MKIFRAMAASVRCRLLRLGTFAAVTTWSLSATLALASPPPAGVVIGNQAIATFTSGTENYSISSNLVEVTINQIAGVTVASDTSKTGAPGGLVFFPHTITNTGNDTDVFSVIATPASITKLTAAAVYADENCDGVPDNGNAITQTPALEAGQEYCVVVETNIAVSSTTGSSTLTLNVATTQTGATNYSALTPASVTDTVNFSTGPAFNIVKDTVLFNDGDGSGTFTPDDTVEITVTYTNIGASDATNVTITDLLPAGLTYVSDSAKWSDSASALTDASGNVDATNGSGHALVFDWSITTANTATAVISTVPVAREGYITFRAKINNDAAGVIENVAKLDFGGNTNGEVSSNISPITIDSSNALAVTLADTSPISAAFAGNSISNDLPNSNLAAGGKDSSTDGDSTANDIVQEDEAVAEGGEVTFEVVLTNHGGVAERFNLTTSNVGSGHLATDPSGATDFPAGTLFFFRTEAGAPILDADADGNSDILVAANSSVKLRVVADLPMGTTAPSTTVLPQALVTATSTTNTAIADKVVLQIARGIVAAGVDLETSTGTADNSANTLADDDLSNGGAAWVSKPANPGETVTFDIVVENTGLTSDSYNLTYSNSYTGGTFTAGALPTGWQVVFKDSTGAVVSNTGLIKGGSKVTFTAEVTPAANATAQNYDLFFRAVSASTSTILDVIQYRVTINKQADIAIRSDRFGQVTSGGVAVLTHTLENVGNVAVTTGTIATSSAFDTFSGSIYVDTDGDGVLDLAKDTLVSDISQILSALSKASFDPGDTALLFHRVQSPSSTVAGLSEEATITVGSTFTDAADSASVTDISATNNSVKDTVTVVSGQVALVKEQALDAACDGTADAAFSQIGVTADPGNCIIYKITATNTGTVDATDVKITDTTPAYTAMKSAAAATTATGGTLVPSISEPADGATGSITNSYGTLIPGGQAVLQFVVKIDE